MKKYKLFVLLQLVSLFAVSQPYVDIVQVRYTNAFHSPAEQRGTPYTHFWAGSDLPLKIKGNTYLLFSPYYENWQLDSASVNHIIPTAHGISLPVGLLLPLNNKWLLSLTAIGRSHGEQLFSNRTFQAGGATFVSYEKSAGKKLRLGLYVNSDFFGFFVMPLLGADWRMNERNYFFGLLPGRFTWEHKFNHSFYGGVTFRAITNSYRLMNRQYVRIDDNQLSIFMDAYPVKNICFTLEPGYGIMRKLRTGTAERKYSGSDAWGDGFFIKLSASYRLRFSK